MRLKSLLIAVVALLISSTFLSASEADSAKITSLTNSFKREIVKQIEFPEAALEAQIEGTVHTKFIVTEEGRIVVTGINGVPELKNPLKKQLEELQLIPQEGLINKEIYLNFRFNLETL